MMKFLKRIQRLFAVLWNISAPNKAPYLITTNGPIISKGKESYHNGNFIVKGHDGILEIGSYCAIGQDVKVILSNHDISRTCMQYTFYKKYFGLQGMAGNKTITRIENDVWIGDNVIILPGITIGTGAILGAGAIVTKDVAPYSIVAGCPARLIRKRFPEDKIQLLLTSEWWNWSEQKIKENKEFFV